MIFPCGNALDLNLLHKPQFQNTGSDILEASKRIGYNPRSPTEGDLVLTTGLKT